MHTLEQLREQVLNYLDQAGETGTAQDVIDDTLRRVHNSRLTERKWNFMLWDEPQTLTTVVGQRYYSLHQEFLRPLFFYNRTANRTLRQRTANTLIPTNGVIDFDSGLGVGDWTAATGSATHYMMGSVAQVQNQPTSASVLTVSGEALKTVIVRGDTADGVTTETITVGTPGSVSFTRILGITKGDGWAQTMTLTSNAAAVTNLKLFANEYGRQYRQIELTNTPTSAESLVYKFYRKPSVLSSDNSIPDIPAPFAEVLVYDALLQIASYNKTIDNASRSLWLSEQIRLDQGLLEYDEGPDAIGAEVQYQSYIARD